MLKLVTALFAALGAGLATYTILTHGEAALAALFVGATVWNLAYLLVKRD